MTAPLTLVVRSPRRVRQLPLFELDEGKFELDEGNPLRDVPAHSWVAGVDEVGRGALFGPVIAAAVLLSPAALSPLITAGVTDSKCLSAQRRQQLVPLIQTVAIDCQIGLASVAEIDRHNILQATLLAMRRAVQKLSPLPDLCLVDGNQPIPGLALPQKMVVKGDQRVLAIACASIIAKVWRDDLITRLAQRYPGYDLAANKGYGSRRHRAALQTLGCTPLHRRSFRPCQRGCPG